MKKFILFLFAFLTAGIPAIADKHTDGVYVLNEDWYGHNNSSLNFWYTSGENKNTMEYYLIQHSNLDLSLGATAQYAQIWDGRMYIMSKQDQDPGQSSDLKGGRFVVVDLNDMKVLKSLPIISQNSKGQSTADGRSVCGVTKDKVYLGTSNGIYVYDVPKGEITKCIHGSENPLIDGSESNADGQGPLYRNQIGMMISTGNHVFAIYQDKGVLVIDPQKDEITDTIKGCFSTMTRAKDGKLYVGTNTNKDYQAYPYGDSGDKWVGNSLTVIDPADLSTSVIDLSELNSESGINSTWYAWTAGSLCASKLHNVLYFTYNDPSQGEASWFSRKKLFKYDIDANTCQEIIDSETSFDDGLYFYGCDVRVRPTDDHLFCSFYPKEVGIASNIWVLMELDADGNKIQQFTPTQNYWYPAQFLFPEDDVPVTDGIKEIHSAKYQSTDIYNLAGQRVSAPQKGIYIKNNKKIIYNK